MPREASPLLDPHAVYLALGATPEARQAAYRELFRYELEPGLSVRSKPVFRPCRGTARPA